MVKDLFKRKIPTLIILILVFIVVIIYPAEGEKSSKDERLTIVATTTMLADLAVVIGKEHVQVENLMGPGIDPHMYQASAGDIIHMQEADMVVYNGLHLEGKMGEVFSSLGSSGKTVVCIGDSIGEEKLLPLTDSNDLYDPHIWFDVSLWKEAARYLESALSRINPENTGYYQQNLAVYMEELDILDTYIKRRTAELPTEQRVLITAHDAFGYLGNAYGFHVKGLQGINSSAECGTADVSNLAAYIAEHKIKAIFIESSVPPKTIEALVAAVNAKGSDVKIGGELYSDSLGDVDSGTGTYILTLSRNIDIIVDALQ